MVLCYPTILSPAENEQGCQLRRDAFKPSHQSLRQDTANTDTRGIYGPEIFYRALLILIVIVSSIRQYVSEYIIAVVSEAGKIFHCRKLKIILVVIGRKLAH